MVHRDIKLLNFVLDDNDNLILIDFGSCYPNISYTKEHKYDKTVRTTLGLTSKNLCDKFYNP
jgi:serine/threonine protein kinase